MDIDGPAVADLVADVAVAVSRRADAVSEDVYEVVLREIPELRDDKPVLALLFSSVHSNVGTCLQVLQHQIDLSAVQAPAAALEYARRRAQRGTPPLTALLRAYRLGHACFSDWLLKELARHSDDAQMITAATLGMSKIVAGYVDQTSEEIVAAYTRERERWLRNRSAARAARIRDLLSGERIDVSATEATLGYVLRQYHVGLVCWAGDATAAVDNITRLEHAISQVAEQAACSASPAFLPRDESSAWAWLPLGIRDTFDAAGARTAGADGDIHFAFGDAVKGVTGFRLTHRQALAAQAVALAAGSPSPRVVTFSEVAPVAMMLGSADLLQAWVLATLGAWPPTMSTTPGCVTRCWSSCNPGAATWRPRISWCCIRTRCSTGSARPRRAWACRRREPPRRGTRAAGQPLARLGRAAAGPRTISGPDGRPLGLAASRNRSPQLRIYGRGRGGVSRCARSP